MDSSTFIAEFAQIANAPNGVQRLREMILDLAVRGKLVPQDPNDEPAEKLLERIKAEKDRLIKEKKIKKQKPLPPIADEEKPFEVPKGWVWVYLSDVVDLLGGGAFKSTEYVKQSIYQVIRLGNVKNDRLLLNQKI